MSTALAERRDLDVGQLVLQTVRAGTWRIDARITGGSLDRTMDGASTLTIDVDDSDRALLRSGAFSRQVDVHLDGVWWRLVKVAKQGDQLQLTFEDRAVALLRGYDKPRKAARSKMTRAEFALSLVREVKEGGGIPFVCPELHVKQKVEIETEKDKRSAATRAANVQQGLAPGAALTVKGGRASANQRAIGQRVLDTANSLNAGERATLALLQACIVESEMQNVNYGDRDSLGVLQVRQGTAAGMGIDNRDVEQCCNAFLSRGFYTDELGGGGAIVIAAKHPDVSTGRVAQATQGSGVPAAYDPWEGEARKWLAAYGGAAGSDVGTITKTLPYQFQRGGNDGTVEDSWTCLQRLAAEVGWRCFVTAGRCYFAAEPTLLKAAPLVALTEDTLGVMGLDFDVDNGKADSTATLTVRASRWAVPPGSVVTLDDAGPADGRWLVQTVSRGLFDALATITLKRATEPLPEPKPETTSVSVGGDTAAGLDGTASPGAEGAYQAAQAIHAKRFPYVWGGGHAHAGTADRGTGRDPGIGFDCTGAVGAVLAAAGLGFKPGDSVPGSGTLAASWGQAGKGQFLTVYACPDLPNQAGHGFIVFHTAQGDQHWGTGDWGKGWNGPGFNPQMHHLTNFTARHWPGT